MNRIAKDAVNISDIILQLGLRNRLTKDKTGKNESVTTHTVMLIALVSEFATIENLDKYACVMHALVHDFSEFEYGDIPTLYDLSSEMKDYKKQIEASATLKINASMEQFNEIKRYLNHHDMTTEAVLVHILDKTLPKITQILSSHLVLKENGFSKEMLKQKCEKEIKEFEKWSSVLPNVCKFHEEICKITIESYQE